MGFPSNLCIMRVRCLSVKLSGETVLILNIIVSPLTCAKVLQRSAWWTAQVLLEARTLGMMVYSRATSLLSKF
jgi:hypothetical protein